MQPADSSRRSKLRALRDPNCRLCPLHSKAQTVCVPGEGSSRLPVMILGEAPGREEDSRGRPFVGASGKLLRSELIRAGVPLTQCYLTNTVKCFPDGTPNKEEIAKCVNSYLKEEIRLLNPAYVLCLGQSALGALTPDLKIGEARGSLHRNWLGAGEKREDGKTRPALIFPVWHPAYILRNRTKTAEWRSDLETFSALISVDL